MLNPTRIALLIGAPGGLTTEFLSGVRKDLTNVRYFLMSARGGAWYDEEIIILDNPDKATIYITLAELYADYFVVYYSGHGFQTVDGRNFLMLTNGEYVEDLLFLNDSPRQLVIADACRNLLGWTISGKPSFLGEDSRYGDPAELKLSREYYDNWILNCLPGKVILHSTGPGTSSYDTLAGGVFTNSLLRAGKSFGSGQTSAKLDILSSARIVMPDLVRRGSGQVPTKTYCEGNGNLPFALAPEKILRRKPKQIVRRKNNKGALVALGLVGLGLILASED